MPWRDPVRYVPALLIALIAVLIVATAVIAVALLR